MWLLSITCLCPLLYCLILPFHNSDAALYAHIADQLVHSGDWVSLVVAGEPWLDKPHLHFWIHAVFMAVLGKAEWVFRLPLLLAVLASMSYLYHLVNRYSKEVAPVSLAAILLSVLYIPLVVLEGRAEVFAMLAVVGGIFHLARWVDDQRLRDAVFAALWLALGMMTKGLFVPLLIGGTVGVVTMARRQVAVFWHWHVLLSSALFALLLLPEIIALRLQFGDRMVTPKYGEGEVTAVRWFLWDSQFGRYSAGRDNAGSTGDLTYYLHTSLWAVFPLGLLLWRAIVSHFRSGMACFRSIPLVGIILFLVPFSLSSFQLPHYLVVIVPLIVWLIIEARIEGRYLQWSAVLSVVVAAIASIAMSQLALDVAYSTYVLYVALCVIAVLIVASYMQKSFLQVHLYAGYAIQACLLLAVIPTMTARHGERDVADYLNTNSQADCVIVHGHVTHRLDYYYDGPICVRSIDNGVDADLDPTVWHVFTRLSVTDLERLSARYTIAHRSTHINTEKDLSLLWSAERLSAGTMIMAVVGPRVDS